MHMYLVVMPNSWGKGETISEAEKKARKEGGYGRKKTKKIVFMYDPNKTPECNVNEIGSLCWLGDRPSEIFL
jgi:hypothetical protein